MSITPNQLAAIVQEVMDEPQLDVPSFDDIVNEIMDEPLPMAEDTSPVLIDDEVRDHLPAVDAQDMIGRLSLYFLVKDQFFTRYQTALKYRRSMLFEDSVPIVRVYLTYQQAQILGLVK